MRVFNAHPRRSVDARSIKSLTRRVLGGEKRKARELNIVFVSDRDIRKLNRRYLSHDANTDVISFRLDEAERIEGEVYVSLDQAARQAKVYGVRVKDEIRRLVIHGILHLVGYRDDTMKKKEQMHSLEDKYLKWENR